VANPVAKFNIRPLKKADLPALVQVSETAGNGMRDTTAWLNYFKLLEKGNLVALAGCVNNNVVAYSITNPVPGLPDQCLLRIVVSPEYQRRKIGTNLFRSTLDAIAKYPVTRLLVRIEQNDTAARAFLNYNKFKAQHRDIHMWLDNLEKVPPVSLPAGIRLKKSPPARIENDFAEYHSLAFADRPRFQPFTVTDVIKEKNENFQNEDIMLIETLQGDPVGFVWAMLWQYEEKKVVQIEPMGVVPHFRGKGIGKLLLYLGLNYGRKRGAVAAELWTSEDNEVAVHLYAKSGFRVIGGFDFYYFPLLTAEQ
jgi:mycothiol synthase